MKLENLTTNDLGRHCIYLDEVDSTNEYLKREGASLPHGTLVLAGCQTAGKGRLGRRWAVTDRDALAMSLLLRDFDVQRLSALPLVCGMAVAQGLPVWAAYLAAVIGNLIPVPFIIVYIRRIFMWMRRRLPKLNSLVDKLERKAHLKGQKVTRYKYLGLAIFVAIPLPGTGAWTGALVASFLDMPLRKAIPSIAAGVVVAGAAISILTFGVSSLL